LLRFPRGHTALLSSFALKKTNFVAHLKSPQLFGWRIDGLLGGRPEPEILDEQALAASQPLVALVEEGS
jgi:hypothetical protein